MATVAVGFDPRGLAFTPDGAFAYVANNGSGGASNVSVIATASNTVVATVAVSSNAKGVAITPDGAFAYVTNGTTNVAVIATTSNTVVATVAVGSKPVRVAITPGPVIEVALDIKPQSCPNPLNLKSRGVLPVAILGTPDFDVGEIDPLEVRLVGVAALRSEFEDVATPFEPFVGREDCLDCTEEGEDGFLDLTLKFDRQAVVSAIEDELAAAGELPLADGDCAVLTLEGELFDGTAIVGEDVVRVQIKGKKLKLPKG